MTDRRSLLDPSELTPLDLDLRRVFWGLIAVWGVALAVVGVLAATGSAPGRAVAVCATGFGLGFVALAWERWRFGPRSELDPVHELPADELPADDVPTGDPQADHTA